MKAQTIFEIAATILTVLGFFFISAGIINLGFSLSLLANSAWIVWAILSGNARGILIVNSLLACASINGILGSI